MPATRIQVFRDPATAATSSGPSAPRRRTAPALGSKGPLTRSVAVEVSFLSHCCSFAGDTRKAGVSDRRLFLLIHSCTPHELPTYCSLLIILRDARIVNPSGAYGWKYNRDVGIIQVRGGGGRNSAKGTLATATKSLITTNVSTITIDDKENRDPVTGLPLSSLLAPGPKGKKALPHPRSISRRRSPLPCFHLFPQCHLSRHHYHPRSKRVGKRVWPLVL